MSVDPEKRCGVLISSRKLAKVTNPFTGFEAFGEMERI